MPTDSAPAPALSDEGRRLIDAVILLHPGFGDRRGTEFQALSAYVARLEAEVVQWRAVISAVGHNFGVGDRVRKTKGSSWQGLVVGFYSTALTPIGYAIESEREPGSVQIYPEPALEIVKEDDHA